MPDQCLPAPMAGRWGGRPSPPAGAASWALAGFPLLQDLRNLSGHALHRLCFDG